MYVLFQKVESERLKLSEELLEELRHTIFINSDVVRVLGGAGEWSIVVKQQGKKMQEFCLNMSEKLN